MKVDLRDKLKSEQMTRALPTGHRARFEERLKKELHTEETFPLRFLAIAASLVLLFGMGYFLTTPMNDGRGAQTIRESAEISLEEYSPELKKIENYYLTAINFELANLEVAEENKALLDSYLSKLNTLTREYQLLSSKLEMDKIDEALINSLIDNLQMRLHLMMELKNELKNLKTEKDEKDII